MGREEVTLAGGRILEKVESIFFIFDIYFQRCERAQSLKPPFHFTRYVERDHSR